MKIIFNDVKHTQAFTLRKVYYLICLIHLWSDHVTLSIMVAELWRGERDPSSWLRRLVFLYQRCSIRINQEDKFQRCLLNHRCLILYWKKCRFSNERWMYYGGIIFSTTLFVEISLPNLSISILIPYRKINSAKSLFFRL